MGKLLRPWNYSQVFAKRSGQQVMRSGFCFVLLFCFVFVCLFCLFCFVFYRTRGTLSQSSSDLLLSPDCTAARTPEGTPARTPARTPEGTSARTVRFLPTGQADRSRGLDFVLFLCCFVLICLFISLFC